MTINLRAIFSGVRFYPDVIGKCSGGGKQENGREKYFHMVPLKDSFSRSKDFSLKNPEKQEIYSMLKYNSLPRGKEGWAGATSLPEVFQGDINRREHQPGNVEPRNGSLFAPFHCVPSSFPLNATDAYRSMQKRGSGGDETKENRPTLKFWGMISQ